jgi:dTDP-4-amino-4,6-dideoxygalactose transaminase/acetyltransferase-like isoleucine patch superfamily enzyme
MSDKASFPDVVIHETACIDVPCRIGRGTRIWHFSHIMAGAEIGENCNIGQNAFIAGSVRLGHNVKIQNNVSIYDGCTLEDDVFCGPSTVFTNIKTPRSHIVRKGQYVHTHVERRATLGANCTIICGHRIGHHALIGAGAVVTKDVVPYALMVGNPARRTGWVGHAGLPLKPVNDDPKLFVCPETGERFRELSATVLEPLAGSHGNDQAPVPVLDLQAQHSGIASAIRAAIDRVVASQQFIMGPEVAAFENEVATYAGAAHAIGCASGSDALLLALLVLDLKQGDEVVTAPYTFFATVGAISRLGLKPVFCDIDPATFNLDPAQLAKRCTPRTRVVMPVHLFGQSANMAPILDFCRDRGIWVIEDAAQALSCRYGSKMAGTLGDLGCYSFFPSKNLGAYGDAGMVVTNNDQWAERLRMLRTHGTKKKYFHDLVGLNSRLDALQAAILRVKLPYLDRWSAARRERADLYRRLFREAGLVPDHEVAGPEEIRAQQADGSRHLPSSSGGGAGGKGERSGSEPVPIGSVRLPPEAAYGYHVYNQFAIRLSAAQRDGVREFLKTRKIATEIYYPLSMHLQRCFQSLNHAKGDFPNSELATQENLALPMFPELSAEQQARVVQAIHDKLKS